MGILFYHHRAWHDLPPSDKKAKPVAFESECELPKPRYRPGYWVRFTSGLTPEVLVGKVAFVESTETGRERWYEVVHGPTLHRVREDLIQGRMIDA